MRAEEDKVRLINYRNIQELVGEKIGGAVQATIAQQRIQFL